MIKLTLNSSRRLFFVTQTALFGFAIDPIAAAEPLILDEVVVESSRVDKAQLKVPAAIGTVDQDEIQLGRQQLGLDESLVNVPGVFFQNRYNFTQDLRISIRGFGARAAFGIRGVKIFQDGIPSTLPDGQGGVDDIDLGSAERIEVVRSPMSSLYGSSSGGVINIYTEEPDMPFVEGLASLGAYGYDKEQLKAGGRSGNLGYLVNVSRMQIDGYRDFSAAENKLLNSKLTYEISPQSSLQVILNAVDSPVSEDPGGLTLAEVKADRRQARQLNVDTDSGEEFDQQKVGLLYEHQINDHHSFRLRNYYVWKDFVNRLPIFPDGNRVEFDRFFYGGGGDYTWTDQLFDHDNRLIVGVDFDRQDDDRWRWSDSSASPGSLFLDQNERVTSYGVFAQNEFALTDEWELTLGLRYDDVRYEVEDRYLADGRNDSGKLDFSEWTPRVSLLWGPSTAINLYATYSTSFETPTTTELRPSTPLTAGFNTDLKAQTAQNYEIGMKGRLNDGLSYDIALFHIDVENELVPRESANDWEYFVNASESTRNGVEAALSWVPQSLPGFTAKLAYTYSDFEYKKFVDSNDNDFAGNEIPGIPENLLHIELGYQHDSGWFGSWDMLFADNLYADDANDVSVNSYWLANLRVGYRGFVGKWEYTPYLGVNNLFDEAYFSNIRINAFGGRYYEPAPERNAYAGITVRYNF